MMVWMMPMVMPIMMISVPIVPVVRSPIPIIVIIIPAIVIPVVRMYTRIRVNYDVSNNIRELVVETDIPIWIVVNIGDCHVWSFYIRHFIVCCT